MDSSREEISRLKKLQDDLARIHDSSVCSFSAAAQAQLRGLLRVPQNVLTKIAQERILASLKLDGLHGRYEMVPEAHSKTFEWVTDDHDNASLDKGRRLAWKRFNTWLSSGNGIFHISGKLGSGKSMLIKFLSSHPNTMVKLQEWAGMLPSSQAHDVTIFTVLIGDRTLVFAHFFFWKPGTPLQKSLSGLCRGLLHDVLRTCPELIPHVLYKAWTKASTTPWQIQLTTEIPDCEIFEGFNRLISLRSVSRQRCFCFFIDGLDEFEETTQYDHRDLVNQLCKWSEVASGQVKLCVSSREHSIFMDAFASERRLRLHQLTRQDIIAFCQDRLGHLTDEARRRLVDAVVEKAQGIFLWVGLVIRSIRGLWEDGASIAELEAEIDSLPDELFGLYEHILNSLSKTMRRNLYQTLAILRLAKIYEIQLSLLRYSLLEDHERDPEFAMAEDFPQEDIRITKGERREHGSRRLNGFKGLLEPGFSGCVDFCHRSVDEFLQVSDKFTNMNQYLHSFNAPDALSQILLGDLRLGPTSRRRVPLWERYYSHSTGLLRLRADHELDKPPYPFLSLLDNIHETSPPNSIDSGYDCQVVILRSTFDRQMICYEAFPPWHGATLDSRLIALTAPIYVLTCLGYHEYPVWKITHDATITSADATILAYCDLLCDSTPQYHANFNGVSVLETLLERGAISPNDIRSDVFRYGFVSKKLYIEPMRKTMSLWHNALTSIYISHKNLIDLHPSPSSGLPSRCDYICQRMSPRDVRLYHRVLRLFLQHKPNLTFAVSLKRGIIEDLADTRSISDVFETELGQSFTYPSLRSFLENSKLKDKEALIKIYDTQLDEERNARNIVTL